MKKSKPSFTPSCKSTEPEDHTVKSLNYMLKGRIWISANDETFLGYGRIVLLERIKEYGSISKAAKSMEMSYKHAWDLVNSMNNLSKKPLVLTSVGGKNGGGTQLSEEGEKAIAIFWELQKDLKEFLNRHKEKLEKFL
jgi:molybdate transport system regulatory protein